MRILQVVHAFLPEHKAGTEIYTYRLAKELAHRHDVQILTGEETNLPAGEYRVTHDTYDNLPVTRIHHGMPGEFRETYDNPKMDEIFSSYLDEYRPEIVHFQHTYGLSANLIKIAKQNSIPTVMTCADYWYICTPFLLLLPDRRLCDGPKGGENCASCGFAYGNWVVRPPGLLGILAERGRQNAHSLKRRLPKIAKRALTATRELIEPSENYNEAKHAEMTARFNYMQNLLTYPDVIFAPSKFLRDQYIKAGIPAKNITVSDYGFDKSLVDERPKSKKTNKPLRIGFMGTLVEHKGVHIAINGMKNVTGVELIVYGNLDTFPTYSTHLKKLARKLPVTFPGSYSNDEVGKVLSELDAVVVPSLWYENSPLVIHEAFMAGVPVITSNIGGMSELVKDGEGGFLFEHNDPKSLGKLLQSLVDNPSLLTDLPSQRDSVKSIEDDAIQMEEIYQLLLTKMQH